LKAYGADVFFDDQLGHCDLAAGHVATGHVPHGVANRVDSGDGYGDSESKSAGRNASGNGDTAASTAVKGAAGN